MKKLIRWQGLSVFFVAAAAIFGFLYLFADRMIENVIEDRGRQVIGARVDLDRADLSLFPVGLELSGLQVANPDQPMRNSVEIDRIKFSVDPGKLLLRKVIINEMAVEGIRPDTPRKMTGAIGNGPEKGGDTGEAGKEAKGLKLPDLKIPDPKEVLAKEKLETVEMVGEYRQRISADREKWQRQLAELPNETTVNNYAERLKRVKSSSGFAGILGGVSELGAIRDEIRADIARLQNAQKDFKAASDSYRKDLERIKSAPQRDITRLKKKYSPSAAGLANLSPLLFGDKTADIVRQALSWYEKAQPFLERERVGNGGGEVGKRERGRGITVRFKEYEPLPDFLIRNIKVTVEIPAGSFAGTIENVTPDQDILGVPLSFVFAGEALQGLDSVAIDGVLDHVDHDQSKDLITVAIKGYVLPEKEKDNEGKQGYIISKGVLDLAAETEIREQNVKADAHATLRSAKITSLTGQGGDAVADAIADTLSGISVFTAQAMVAGTLDDYTVRLSSNLDGILKKAVGDIVSKKIAAFERELSDEVRGRVQGPIAEAGGSFSEFGGISAELDSRLQQLGGLI